MKKTFSLGLVSFLLVLTLAGCKGTRLTFSHCGEVDHPALKIIKVFTPVNGERSYVIPYTVNLFSIYILRHDLNSRDVARYIDWYLDNLNYPDKHDLTGSIYDYEIYRDGRQVAIQTYDSVDSYAATFLILLHEYYLKTGHREILDFNRAKIMDIAYLLLFLQDQDGLTKALPDSDAKYLMDNCEVYAGLKAFNELSGVLGWQIPFYYAIAEKGVKQAIFERLYDESAGLFHWAVDDQVIHESCWENYYPDAFAQIFPVLYGVLDPASEKSQRLWQEFSSRYESSPKPDSLQAILVQMTRERLCFEGMLGPFH